MNNCNYMHSISLRIPAIVSRWRKKFTLPNVSLKQKEILGWMFKLLFSIQMNVDGKLLNSSGHFLTIFYDVSLHLMLVCFGCLTVHQAYCMHAGSALDGICLHLEQESVAFNAWTFYKLATEKDFFFFFTLSFCAWAGKGKASVGVKTAKLYAWVALQTLPEEMVISPCLLDFLEKALETIPITPVDRNYSSQCAFWFNMSLCFLK